MKYVFPAIFTEEENNYFSVNFIDVKNCFTSGLGIEEAIEMAEDALSLMLYTMEERNEEIPKASKVDV
jgi:predicted RNase H-like HicB family nuclease